MYYLVINRIIITFFRAEKSKETFYVFVYIIYYYFLYLFLIRNCFYEIRVCFNVKFVCVLQIQMFLVSHMFFLINRFIILLYSKI